MTCEQCGTDEADLELPTGEPACTDCLESYWEQVLEGEGLSATLQYGR